MGNEGCLDFAGHGRWTQVQHYGYMLLGQIIETVAGMPYETFVQERLLEPLAISRWRLGRTLFCETGCWAKCSITRRRIVFIKTL